MCALSLLPRDCCGGEELQGGPSHRAGKGRAVLEAVTEAGSDFMVMGAFGESRIEALLGLGRAPRRSSPQARFRCWSRRDWTWSLLCGKRKQSLTVVTAPGALLADSRHIAVGSFDSVNQRTRVILMANRRTSCQDPRELSGLSLSRACRGLEQAGTCRTKSATSVWSLAFFSSSPRSGK